VIRRNVATIHCPNCPGEVPEVDGLAVGDEEDLPGDLLGGVGRRRGDLVHHTLRGEDVRVRSVLDVREVEEVVVCAELEFGLVVFEDG